METKNKDFEYGVKGTVPYYRTLDAVPHKYQPVVKKLMKRGVEFKDREQDEVNGKPCLDITIETLKVLDILDQLHII